VGTAAQVPGKTERKGQALIYLHILTAPPQPVEQVTAYRNFVACRCDHPCFAHERNTPFL